MITERRVDPERIDIDVPVTVTTVLNSRSASIVNLNEQGAMLAGVTAPVGTRFQIDYEGQTVFCIVAWSEPDRMGARFPFGLIDGPLYDRLQEARSMPEHFGFLSLGNSHRAPATSFGRRRDV